MTKMTKMEPMNTSQPMREPTVLESLFQELKDALDFQMEQRRRLYYISKRIKKETELPSDDFSVDFDKTIPDNIIDAIAMIRKCKFETYKYISAIEEFI